MMKTCALTIFFLVILTGGVSAAQDGGRLEVPGTGDYVIGIEDGLRIVVWNEAELTDTVQVRPDGKITVALIGDVRVAGMTPPQVADKVSQQLAEYIREPNVTVIVDQINSFRVYFLGEINNQGAIQFFRPTRILQAIATAGGLSEFSKKKIVLLREQGGVEKRIEIDYKQLLSGDLSQENIYLKPGDTLLFY